MNPNADRGLSLGPFTVGRAEHGRERVQASACPLNRHEARSTWAQVHVPVSETHNTRTLQTEALFGVGVGGVVLRRSV